jgi:hypothetical protein
MSKSTFNICWLTEATWFWLKEVKGSPYKAYCEICQKDFILSNMGRQAVVSHSKSASHRKKEFAMKNAQPMTTFLSSSLTAKTPSVVMEQSTPNILMPSPLPAASPFHQLSIAIPVVLPLTPSTTISTVTSASANYFQQESVTKAELVWSMKVIMSGYSYNSCRDLNNTMKAMFPDSHIAEQFSLGSDKASYLINFAIAPYFHEKLLLSATGATAYVICFDESLNEIAQRGQMDLIIRFWDDDKQQVATRYLTSVFMGHATAEDILHAFKTGLGKLDTNRLIQVSMDGPNVNWKFLQLLDDDISGSPEDPKLLEFGSCGLHVIHGAVKTGHGSTHWNLHGFLRALYYLFKNSPARRSDYVAITGSNVFPKKFCLIRWTENVAVTTRAMSILTHVRKYVQHVEKTPKCPTSESFKRVQTACVDPLLEAKLSFFSTVSSIVEPFLQKYQTSQPMIPFLYDDLNSVLHSLMSRLVKPEKLQDALKSLSLWTSQESNSFLCHVKNVDLGVAATSALQNAKCGDQARLAFRIECQTFLVDMVKKIIERSPLVYKLVRFVSCLSPMKMLDSREICEKRMRLLVQTLFDKRRLPSTTADAAKSQYSSLLSAAHGKWNDKFTNFSLAAHRVDTFFAGSYTVICY